MKFSEKIEGVLYGLLYIIGSFLFVAGLIHSYRKHSSKDFVLTIIIPPLTIYRGMEMFWHKDEVEADNIDWDKRLSSDLRSSIYLLTEGAYKDANIVQMNETTEQFSNKIKDYPKDKKKYLMDGCRDYITYTFLGTRGNTIAMNDYFETGVFVFSVSDSTKIYKDKLINIYKLNDLIEPLEASLKEQANQMSNGKPITDKDVLTKMKSNYNNKMNIYITKAEGDMKRIFKNIFNEEF